MRLRRAAVILAALLIPMTAAILLTLRSGAPSEPGPRPASERPPLMLLTTLPLVFPEHFALNAPALPALKALQSRYRVIPISVADTAELDHRSLLLMAQPRAQPAEALVELDDWVRRGGRVLLLADPALEWSSDRRFGSLLRPPFAFEDTGLLAHWGLQLSAPDKLGPAVRIAAGRTIRTQSPGKLIATGHNCSIESDGFIARCRIGAGEATVIADADFLAPDPENLKANLGMLLVELQGLEH